MEPTMQPTLAQIEAALDAGLLEVHMMNGKWWKARRNGATKLWKNHPGEFRIPIKYGFSHASSISHIDAQHEWPNGFRFAEGSP